MTLKKSIIDELHLLDSLDQWDDIDLAPDADKILELFENVIDSIKPAQGMEYHCVLAVRYAQAEMKKKLYEIFEYPDGTFTSYKNNSRHSIQCVICHKTEYTNLESYTNVNNNFVCDTCKDKLREEIKG